jgi:hypothetical protein
MLGRLFFILLAIVGTCRAQNPGNDPRQTLNFNRDWKFELGDHPGAEVPGYDDANWEAIGLPHSFSIPYFLSSRFYIGYGWYRKHFDAPASWAGKRVFLEFEGAFRVAEIFVNGRKVGEHKAGYTGFSLDITDAVVTGSNVVAVRLNNLWDPQLAPRAGEHVFSGGIYRDVNLVITDPLHVPWYGTFVTTPDVSADSGTVNVKTEVRNDDAQAKHCVLTTDLFDPAGAMVASFSAADDVPAGATVTFNQTSPSIPKPELWAPDHPWLYRAVSSLYDGRRPADRFETTFGFRWFKFTADQGFFLNGAHYYFKGANVHQDHAGWGDAVTDAGVVRDVQMVKDAGFDFIRGSHYPHHPAFSEACDRLGILFWSENCFWGSGGFKGEGSYNTAGAYPANPKDQPGFEESVRENLEEMIRIHRNHPSIIVWSMGNEDFFTDSATLPNVRTLLAKMVALTHQLDPTRPAGIGGCQRGDLDKLGDIAGYNGDGARLFINPGVPNVVTEYGSTASARPGKYEPGWGGLQQQQLPWRSGQALWCAFDHGSMAGSGFGRMGMVDYFRLPKRMWYWYRNAYRNIPPPEWPRPGTPAGLTLTADKTTLKSVDGTDDTRVIATIVDSAGKQISNSPPVTLTVQSGPGEFPTGPSISFDPQSDIAIRDGQAAIEFRSYYAGETIIRATSPGLPDATLTIVSEGSPAYVPGITPPVKARPYARFGGPVVGQPAIFGLENPTRASSEAPHHAARWANDGNPATFWQAANAGPNEWWQVDMERIVSVTGTRLTFPDAGNYRYKIEVSDDGGKWKPAIDQTATAATGNVRTDATSGPVIGRFLRVTLTGLPGGKPAALSEVEVHGTLVTQ